MALTGLLPLSAQELCESIRLSRPVDVRRLDRILRVEPSVVEAQAGVTWTALGAALRPGDAAAQSLRTTRPTIGESLAWNAAGPDGRPTVTHVESFTIVTPEGQFRRVNRISNPKLFALTVGGQGLFGALYSVTLRLESLERALLEAQLPEPVIPRRTEASACKLQLLVPPEKAHAFVGDTRRRCAEWRIGISSLELRRVVAENETYLRWARRDFTEITLGLGESGSLGARVRARQVCGELIDEAIAQEGAFPIACTPQATREQTLACYPELAGFLSEQRCMDPHDRMANAWLKHHRTLLSGENCDVRWAH